MKKLLLLLLYLAGNAAASGPDDLRTVRAPRAGTGGVHGTAQVRIADSDNYGKSGRKALARASASVVDEPGAPRPGWDRSVLQCAAGERDESTAEEDVGSAVDAAGAMPIEAAHALGSTPMACRPRQFTRTTSSLSR